MSDGSSRQSFSMRFRVNVVRGRYPPESLTVEGLSLAATRQQLEANGFFVLNCIPVENWRWTFPERNRKRFDLEVFLEQLRDLLTAGLSLIESLDALRRGASTGAVQVIERLENNLRGGISFSDALARETAFPRLLVALVRTSELTSSLPPTLERFLEHERRVTEVRHRVVSVSIYPMLLLIVGTGVLGFLLFYVMPRFARVFEGMQGTLPWAARAMLAWSQFLAAQGPLLWAGLAALGLLMGIAVAEPNFRSRIAGWLLDLRPVRQRLSTYFLARWYRGTGMLVAGGIPLPEALALSHDLLPTGLRPGGMAVEQAVRSGLSPAAAFAKSGMATPIAEQLLLAGERTGELGAVLTRVAAFHEADVSRALERAMRSLEPLVMVAIGLGVGLVVVLMYLPIFELASAIQ